MSTLERDPSTEFGFDLSAVEFWQDRTPAQRDEAFQALRDERPISWWGPVETLVSLPPEMLTGGSASRFRWSPRSSTA